MIESDNVGSIDQIFAAKSASRSSNLMLPSLSILRPAMN